MAGWLLKHDMNAAHVTLAKVSYEAKADRFKSFPREGFCRNKSTEGEEDNVLNK